MAECIRHVLVMLVLCCYHLGGRGDKQAIVDNLFGFLEVSTAVPSPSTESFQGSSTLMPWYLKPTPKWNKSFTETNNTRSEVKEMMKKIGESMKVSMEVRVGGHNIRVGDDLYWLHSGSKMESLSVQGLCQRADVVMRISCTDRCGEVPQNEEIPGQCGCDQDCFLFGDCCEDLNALCPDVFAVAVRKAYLQHKNLIVPDCASTDRKYILSGLTSLQKLVRSDNAMVYDVKCLDTFNQMDVTNIQEMLNESQCELANSRSCDRPDVLVCAHDIRVFGYQFYPLHLVCFNHAITKPIFNRFRKGPSGIEIISKIGDCSHLRLASNTKAAALDIYPRTYPQTHLELTVKTGDGATVFDFMSSGWGILRCRTGHSRDDWRCLMHDCFDRRLMDGEFNTCYRPDRVNVEVVGTHALSIPGTTQHAESAGDGEVASLCVCLKAQVFLTTIGWWRRVSGDTLAALVGQCSLKLDNTPTVRGFRDTIEYHNWSSNATTNVEVKGNNGDASLDKDDLSYYQTFSRRLRQIWEVDRRCSEEDYSHVLLCFSNSKITGLNATCFNLRKSKAAPRSGVHRDDEIARGTGPCIFVGWTTWLMFLLSDSSFGVILRIMKL